MTDTTETNDSAKTKSRSGCVPIALLVGAAMLGCGVYLMNRWDTIGGAGKSGAVMMIVLGTLVLLPFLLVTGIQLFIRYYLKRAIKEMGDATGQMLSGATEMLDGAKAMYSTIHEFRPATEEDFEAVNREYYESTTAQLTARGFRHLGDVVDETIEEQGQTSPPIRVLSSADGSTGVAIYHVALPIVTPKFQGKELRIADVTTEFTDGTFAITSNTKELDMMTPPPAINSSKHSLDTDVFGLLDLHERRKTALLAAKPGATGVVINTLDEALESERRQQAVKNAFRKQIDYLDAAEVRDIARTVDTGDGEVDAAFPDMAAGAVEDAKRRARADD